MKTVIGGPFLIEEERLCTHCRQKIRNREPALFSYKGIEHAVHALGGMLPDDIPTFSEWLDMKQPIR